MSDVKKCDRCGRFYDAEHGGQFLVIRKNIFFSPNPIIAGDLCSDCLKVIGGFFMADKDISDDEYNGGGWDD